LIEIDIMKQITEIEVKKRFALNNPWWEEGEVDKRFRDWPRRAYFDGFYRLVAETKVRRAVVLMGPRRVGKTVMIHQAIQRLLDKKVPPRNILYISVDTPVYTDIRLEKLLNLFQELHSRRRNARLYVFYDEIQYLPDWEVHLKSLVDSYPSIRFVASGSAAAALKLKSRESGAGRFTDFILPPLTFAEFLRFRGIEDELIDQDKLPKNIHALNDAFIDYLNFGGFPEAIMEGEVRNRMDLYVAEDIIDKVLLRDVPSLYGIADPQELKRFFATLAYNTGQEVSINELSQSSQVAKNTLKKYLEYLEAAFLVCRLYRIDGKARRFKKQTHFKVYLTNPCLRAALYGAVGPDDEAMGGLAETALVSQYAHSRTLDYTYYARWKNQGVVREVDMVTLDRAGQRPIAAEEIKWSDRACEEPKNELKGFLEFCRGKNLKGAIVYTRTKSGHSMINGVRVPFHPIASACYIVGIFFVDRILDAGKHPFTGLPFIEGGAGA